MLEQGFRNLRVSGARFHWRRRLSQHGFASESPFGIQGSTFRNPMTGTRG